VGLPEYRIKQKIIFLEAERKPRELPRLSFTSNTSVLTSVFCENIQFFTCCRHLWTAERHKFKTLPPCTSVQVYTPDLLNGQLLYEYNLLIRPSNWGTCKNEHFVFSWQISPVKQELASRFLTSGISRFITHYATLHYITLHYLKDISLITTLQCATLHCTTLKISRWITTLNYIKEILLNHYTTLCYT
jgi:hypothetical protein